MREGEWRGWSSDGRAAAGGGERGGRPGASAAVRVGLWRRRGSGSIAGSGRNGWCRGDRGWIRATMPTAKPSAYLAMPRGTYADGLAVGIVIFFIFLFF